MNDKKTERLNGRAGGNVIKHTYTMAQTANRQFTTEPPAPGLAQTNFLNLMKF